jgi:phage terminase large subunit GpA-like protein
MDEFNVATTRHIVLQAGTQLGKTEVLYNIDGYIIDLCPSPALLVYPREDDGKMISRTRLRQMMMACEQIRAKLPKAADLFQTLEQHFPGMVQYIVGANSPAGMAIKACQYILRDEIDKFPDSAGEDSDPLSLSEARAKSFWDVRKVIDVSSPTTKKRGIARQIEKCDEVREYEVSCPHCGVDQVFRWANVKWDKAADDAPWSDKIAAARNTSRYVCPECGGIITDGHKPAMLAAGKWRAKQPSQHTPEMVGFIISSLYSPFLTWGDIAVEFVKATRELKERGNRKPLQEFTQGWLAECWEEEVKVVQLSALESRKIELPPLVVPAETIAVVGGIDTQKNGFYASAWAFDANMQSHCAHYEFLASWEQVRRFAFDTYFQRPNGEQMTLWRCGIDTGGTKEKYEDWSRTAEVYHWLRHNGGEVVFGTKGMSRNAAPGQLVRHSIIDKMPGKNGEPIPGGLVLWMIDADQLKELFFWRLNNTGDEPQKITFHACAEKKFFDQLTAEVKKRDRNSRWVWTKIRNDNHYLDTAVIAHAVADFQFMGGIPILAKFIEQQGGERDRREEDGERDSWISGRGGYAGSNGWLRGRR